MRERLWILIWVPVVFLIYLAGLMPFLLVSIILLGLFEIFERKSASFWKYVAVLHMFGLFSMLALTEVKIYFVVLVVVANDAFAYVGGKYFNFFQFAKVNIFPKTSPKKTVGGLIYGLLAGSLVGWLFALKFGLSNPYAYFSLGVCLFAVAGDFVESKFKRWHKIKDSGEGLFTGLLLKGHGGIYDRFDAIALAAPAMLVMEKIFL